MSDTPEENSTTQSNSLENELSALDSEIDDILNSLQASGPPKAKLSEEEAKQLEELDSLIDDW